VLLQSLCYITWVEGFVNEGVRIAPHGSVDCRGVGGVSLQGDGACLESSCGVGEWVVAHLFEGGCVLWVPRSRCSSYSWVGL
jgi:hypothetical protein